VLVAPNAELVYVTIINELMVTLDTEYTMQVWELKSGLSIRSTIMHRP